MIMAAPPRHRVPICEELSQPLVEVADESDKPLSCRLNLWHRWRTFSSDDARYQRCIACNKERDVPTVTAVGGM